MSNTTVKAQPNRHKKHSEALKKHLEEHCEQLLKIIIATRAGLDDELEVLYENLPEPRPPRKDIESVIKEEAQKERDRR